jgi:hypothetical protein
VTDESGSSDRDPAQFRCAVCGRVWRPPASARYGKEGFEALQWDLTRDGWTVSEHRADPKGMIVVDVFCPDHADR